MRVYPPAQWVQFRQVYNLYMCMCMRAPRGRHPGHPLFLRIALIQTGCRRCSNIIYITMYTRQYNLLAVQFRFKRPNLCYISFERNKKPDCVYYYIYTYIETQLFSS